MLLTRVGGVDVLRQYRRVGRCISGTPGPIFHGRCPHGWNDVGAEEVCVGYISPGAFRRRTYRLDIGALLIERSSVETLSEACHIHRRIRDGFTLV